MKIRYFFKTGLLVSILTVCFTTLLFAEALPRWNGFERVKVSDDGYVYYEKEAGEGTEEVHNEYRLRVRSHTRMMRDAYLKFSLENTDYMFGSDVDSCYLQITYERTIGASRFAAWDVGDNTWSELELCWGNKPWDKERAKAEPTLFETPIYEQMDKTDPGKKVAFDMTDYVKNQLDQGNSVFSIVLSDTTYGEEWATNTDVRIFAKDCVDSTFSPPTDKDIDSTFIPCIFIQGPNTSSVKDNGTKVPAGFSVSQNYPNPFNPETQISFQTGKTGHVQVTIVDMLGKEIRTLVNEDCMAGSHRVTWNGLNAAGNQVASGIYFARVRAQGQTKMIKMTLIR